ncbi:iron-containing alcohol dehydrogenase [Ilyobacter polytropus]|uniref:Iron-containing alcohol dehydrogenase n=1 Tax=Ilyobacter polytropus (strain ATCC 51220 / DSM 2926 / LMG 16218 / CuHBu1) TaxID=572544 RepID=E3H602_ILYPC|nr:iron-containing alcohol dehydrogenase [Ilyobacter polytropus]ADO82292.1 iron-containing alcohol dehydrogenase [Ilyobacter polytropus DSM 2926]
MYSYFIPTVNLMGRGAVSNVGKQAKILNGSKALLITDEILVKIGVAEKIISLLNESGVETSVYDKVNPNPTVKNVSDALSVYQNEKCDIIIALGGGSSIDCAKGVGILATNGGNISDYEGVDKSENPMPPFITINTTAGTGSEMTRFTIITNTDTSVKMAIVDWHVTPTVSINDPELMISMPASLTAATGMDALTHAIEAYVSTIATPVTDSAAIKAVELISKYLRPAVANGENIEAREMMAYAAFLAGMAFNNASLGNVHAMAHQLGGFYNLPHGVCNAILLPQVQEFNLIAYPERFADIARALGENIEGISPMEAGAKAISAIKRLSKDVGIPSGLRELGVKEEDFPILADNTLKDVCIATNPRKSSKNQIIQLFRDSM